MAKLADEAENYDDMVEFTDKVAETVDTAAELTLEERNLLSIAYKNLIAGRRASLKRIRFVEKKKRKTETLTTSLLSRIRVKIESEITMICDQIINLIDSPSS